MNNFQELGFKSYNGKLHVRNSLLNPVPHEKPSFVDNDKTANVLNQLIAVTGQN